METENLSAAEILQPIENSPAVNALLQGDDDLGNLSVMEEALLWWAAFQKDPKTRIIVKKNKYEAQQLFSRLSMLQDQVLLFVMEESLRVQAIAASPEERELLVSSLGEMRSTQPKLIVTNTAAFLRYLPERKLFDSLCFTIKPGDELSMEELRSSLNRAGYARTNYVDRPCEFANRGGIVDIYPLNHPHPIRVEFFDTEVESVRYFDPSTQRTISQLNEAEILPAADILFSDEQIASIKEKLTEKLAEKQKELKEEEFRTLQDTIEEDIRALESYDPENRLYRYYAWTNPSSILDYANGPVCLSTAEGVEDFAKKNALDNAAYMQEEVQDHKALPRYTMFHDLYLMEQQRKTGKIHDFVSFDHPIQTGIRSVQPPHSEYMRWIPEEAVNPKVYFALEKEDIRVLSEKMDISALKFVPPIFYEGFETDAFTVYTRNEIFHRRNRHLPYQKSFREGSALSDVLELHKGDYIVHAQYGIGQYLGIVTREQNGKKGDYLHIAYRDGDDLFVPLSQFQLVRKYVSKEGTGTRLSKLGSGQWEKTKAKVSEKVEEIAGRLVDLYAARSEDIGYAFPKDSALEQEFDDAFEFESTPDQLAATAEIKAEMEKPKPMDHLLIGDVGYGKTEVAMRAAFKAAAAGKQVAFLCPTTILSMQHYATLESRFAPTGVRIALVNRFISAKDMKKVREGLANGQIDIVVGTHRLFSKTIKFKDLGFLIIDEEQRFGVEHKEKIKEMKNSIDVLSLSATPIPRTLQMSLIGVRTISQLNTPPAHRLPIQTYVMEQKGSVVEEIIQRELARDGQVFYLHNRVQDIFRTAKELQEKFPDAAVGVAHGRMSRDEIEEVMMDFSENKYQILVCTTIIETGLDIANANTIIIENADRFGLAQLYQIRGRVGRRERLAYCYLMVTPDKQLNEEASKRLKAIREFTQLGSGYKIAMRDLTIRGAGDMLGPKQAGFIDQVGLDLYLDMLSEAIARKKGIETEPKQEMKRAQIASEGYIPAPFTSSDGDKLSLYQDLQGIQTMKELEEYQKKTEDLFGKIPKEVQELFETRRIDLFANEPGVDSIKESKNQIEITMDPKWSSLVNGLKLFEDISRLSKAIRLSYKNKQIRASFEKKRGYRSMLTKIMKILMDPAYMKTR